MERSKILEEIEKIMSNYLLNSTHRYDKWLNTQNYMFGDLKKSTYSAQEMINLGREKEVLDLIKETIYNK